MDEPLLTVPFSPVAPQPSFSRCDSRDSRISMGSADPVSVFSTTDPVSSLRMMPTRIRTPSSSPQIGSQRSPSESNIPKDRKQRNPSISSVFSTYDSAPWFRVQGALDDIQEAVMLKQETLESRVSDHSVAGRLQSILSAFPVALPLFLLSYSSCVSYSQIITENTPLDANVVTAMHLLSCGLTGIFLPLRSPCWFIISSADITVTVFYKQILHLVIQNCQEDIGLSEQDFVATALMALPVNTLLVSFIFWLVGRSKSTVVLSYLPYPVVAGFLASIGWAIFAGSLPVVTGVEFEFDCEKLSKMFDYWPQLLCTAGVACGSSLLRFIGASARIHAVAPIIFASLAFWLVLLLLVPSSAQSDVKELWLFPILPEKPFWNVWIQQAPQAVKWHHLLPDLYMFPSLSLVVLMSLALRVTGIEGSTGIPMNIDDEMKRTGMANLAVGLCGGVIGSHSPGLTTFNMTAGSQDWCVAAIVAILQLLLWLSGLPARNILPRFMLAGILMNLGVVMLFEWMWASKAKVGWSGLIIIYSQFFASIYFSMLRGVLLGVVITSIVYNGRLLTFSVLKYHVSGSTLRSPVRRSQEQQFVLNREFDQVEAMGLDGYLSEGPMLRFTRYVQRYANSNERLRFLILDFRSCHQFTPWSCALLVKMDHFLCGQNVTVLYANAEPCLAKGLQSFGLDKDRNRCFDTLPEALVHCEDYILSLHGQQTEYRLVAEDVSERDLVLALAELLNCSYLLAAEVAAHGQWKTCHLNQVLAVQGRRESQLHFCLPKHSIVGELADTGRQSMSEPLKIALYQMGTICGIETMLYDECSRSTFVMQDWNCRVLSMQKDDFKQLAAKVPSVRHYVESVAARQFLYRGDSLAQVVDVSKGGGWRGARFDASTKKFSASILETEPLFFSASIRRRYS